VLERPTHPQGEESPSPAVISPTSLLVRT
jgi:hypothetical protein